MHLMVAYAFVQPLAIFPNVHLMPQTTYVLPSEESQQIFTISNAPPFSGITQNVGLSIFAAISAAVGPQMREADADSSGDGVFDFLDRGHDFTIQNKRARRRADLWMILFHGREIWRKNLVDDFSIRAILVGRTFF